ncbi:acyl-CoA synthetase [Pseudonocardiaceae bacterium YIM PH 21723]|nr:acyl-CoA synthetase [Pseudonocardiaceae bacterium YIM PH 21723]
MLLPHGDFPDQLPAVRVGDHGLHRADLFAAATAVADKVHGAPAVAVHATPSLETVLGVLGCLIAGVPVVPVPADSGPAERGHLLRDSGAGIWLGPPLDDVSLPQFTVDATARSSASYPEPDATSRALILYTSGTTGAPKGAVHTRASLAAGLDGLATAWEWTPDDVLVHGLPLFHVHGLVLGVLGALRIGSPLIHTVKPTPAAYAAAGGSLYFGVPTVWSRVCQDPDSARKLGAARLLVSGSAALPVPVAEELARLTGQVPAERYGMTETLIPLAQRASGERRVGWVGSPIDGVETRLEHDDDGEVGELWVRGSTLFTGYLGRDDPFTPDGWFRTGDAAVIDTDGSHRIVGRQSVDIIKTGGYKVGAGEVESCLLTHPAVREVAVVGVPDDDLGQRVVAYVVGEPVSAEELIDHVAGQLSAHKRPREIRFLEALPRNPMGKVQKNLLMG